MDYPAPVEKLIDELRKLPGIGPKSAQRIAFHLLRGSREEATRLAEAIATLLDGVRTCTICHAVTDREVCAHCADPARSGKTICVVEEPHDVIAVEKTRDFRGRYHVLHGALSPLSGIGPDELRVQGSSIASGVAESRRSSWPRARPSKAKRPPYTWRACSSRWASVSPGSRWACPSAATWSGPTR